VLAVVLNLALFALLLGYTIHTGPASTWITLLAVLALSFAPSCSAASSTR